MAEDQINQDGILSAGAEVVLNSHTYLFSGGEILMGGSPSRVARLKPAAAAMVTPHGITVTDAASRMVAEYLLAGGLADPDPHTLPALETSDITVVIPCYRRARQLKRLLGSISAELPGSRVIVVDDASGQQTAEIRAVTEDGGAELVVLEENGGPAEARNAGLELVETPYVLFVDTDVVLRPGSIKLLLRHFADPGLAAAAPRVLGLEQPEENWILRYERSRSSLDHGPDPSQVRPHSPMPWVSTTCLLARTQALGEGFGAGMRVAEDVDLIWRLSGTGWRVRYEPRAQVDHEHRESLRGWLSRKYVYGTGAATLAQKHGDLVAPAVMSPWAGGVLVALAAQRRWSVPVAAGIAAVATAVNARKLKSTAPERSARLRLAARLTGFGLSSAAGQGLALTVRHWWPGVAVAGVASKRVRRLLLVGSVAEAVWEYARLKPDVDPIRFLLARRLDDAAYGLGVWSSAVRARSIKALLPARPKSGQKR